ncbi:MAG: T9SS type A sorting domain-containing protein [Bacteroidota bacterium]|nr:T9SS type A sorting domain-containing protein [Bacteroidota bacterium]
MKNSFTSPLFRIILIGVSVGFANFAKAQSDPIPYNAWPATYIFNNWPATSVAGTYPPNMVFHYCDINEVDPTLAQINGTGDYVLAYNLTSQTRLEGLDADGISFLNTSPGHSTDSTGNLGETVLALNTTGRSSIQVSWKAGTVLAATRIYKLRAQYRIGIAGSYIDLPNSDVSDIEYTSPGTIDSNGETFGPITLPSSCENQAVVQIRWAYYYSGLGSGSRTKINLTNIIVTSSAGITGISETNAGKSVYMYPNPVTSGDNIQFSELVTGSVYDIYGRIVASVKNVDHISTETFSKGVYVLQTNENRVIRFVIK